MDSDSDSEDDQPLFQNKSASDASSVNLSTPLKKSMKFLSSDDSDNDSIRVKRRTNGSPTATTKYNNQRKRKSVSPRQSNKRPRTVSRPSAKKSPTKATYANPLPVDNYPVKPEIKPLLTEKDAVRWWDKEPYKGDIKWTTLDHNGVVFPPPYQPHNVKLLYDGKPLDLTPEQEELATFYAQMIET